MLWAVCLKILSRCLLQSEVHLGPKNIFYSCFKAQGSVPDDLSDKSSLPPAPAAFVLLANFNSDCSQRVSVPAAAASRGEEYDALDTAEAILDTVSYQAVPGVIWQCDRQESSSKISCTNPMRTGNARTKGLPAKTKQNKRLDIYRSASLTSSSRCRMCNELTHWENDHDADVAYRPIEDGIDNPPFDMKKGYLLQHGPDTWQAFNSGHFVLHWTAFRWWSTVRTPKWGEIQASVSLVGASMKWRIRAAPKSLRRSANMAVRCRDPYSRFIQSLRAVKFTVMSDKETLTEIRPLVI